MFSSSPLLFVSRVARVSPVALELCATPPPSSSRTGSLSAKRSIPARLRSLVEFIVALVGSHVTLPLAGTTSRRFIRAIALTHGRAVLHLLVFEHVRQPDARKQCGDASICEHGQHIRPCNDCGFSFLAGAAILAAAVLALRAPLAVLADACAAAVLALVALSAVLADACTTAVLAL